MAADIDVHTLAVFAAVPESTVNSILAEPTPELVHNFLQILGSKAKHCDEVKSQKTKLEVELETVVRTNESKTKVLQNSRDKALTEVTKLRHDLQAAESTRAQVQSDLDRLQQSVESEASETATLRNRITSIETSHRDTLSLLEAKSKRVDELIQDRVNDHDTASELRKQNSKLEQEKQEASFAAQSAKFRQVSLEQELEIQKKNIDWYDNERKIKSEEHQKFRQEKNAKLAELQRTVDQLTDDKNAEERSKNSYQAQLQDQVTRNDDLLKQLEKLREKEIADAEEHRVEVDNLRRLAELQKASTDTARTRVEELSAALDEAREDASDEIGRIRAEVQEEHNEREAAEQRVIELEEKISELEAERLQSRNRPTTPRSEINGQMPSTPVRAGTPLAAYPPRSGFKLKNGMNYTQLLSEYQKVEKDLFSERKATEQLQTYVDQMLQDLEASKPQIDELRSDQARLQSEVAEMSELADEAKQQRDAAEKELGVLRGLFDKARTELDGAQQMCRDLGSQVRRLLLEQQAESLGRGEYNRLVAEFEEMNQRDMSHLSNAQQAVNQHLISFGSIAELQALNEKQLSTIRNLVAQLESEEARETQLKRQQLQTELEAANAKIFTYQEEIQRMVTQTKSFVKERDMFRSMLTRRGQIDPADFSRSLPAGGLSTSMMSDRASPAAENDLAKLLRDMQAQYDSFRQESQAGLTTLKIQIAELSQRNTQLQTEASRSLGQFTAATQRFEMLQGNYDTLKLEHQELQKRSTIATENATKQELRTQQAAEELVEAKGVLDSLRRETANLKAEKDLWKSIEKRLIDDNESLRSGRALMNQMSADLQNMVNESKHLESEAHRRYEAQIKSLETERDTARRRLDEEQEERKQATLRRSYENEQSQKRIDELVSNLSATREELAAAKTSKDHLQARVDEMTVELRFAEERLEVFAQSSASTAPHLNGLSDNTLSREQELAVEVSELRRDLDLKSAELAKAEENLEQYKDIAQEAESRLQEFVEANDEDKADLNASLEQKISHIKDVEQRVEDITAELSTINAEYLKVRNEKAEVGRKLDEQKASFQAEIDQLKASEARASEQAKLYLEASREQQHIAEQRQQSYETELLKHTEAVKALQTVRAEANQIRLELVGAKSAAENAQTDLQQKQASWSEVEARHRQALLDGTTRCDELKQHNESLHATLETLSTQLAALKRDRRATMSQEQDDDVQINSQDLSSLQEVVKYVRQEKEIVEVQLHLVTSERDRLQRQKDSLQSQLDDSKVQLGQQQRTNLDIERNTMEHDKLINTLNELKLYRESAVTLRAEKEQAEQTLRDKTQKIEELEQELILLKSRIVEREHLLQLKQDEMTILEKDRNGWRDRTQNILSKYDRADPTELEELKKQKSDLETERDHAVAAQAALQMQVEGHPEALDAAKAELRQRLGDQFKIRDREMKEKRSQLSNELADVKEQLAAAMAREEALKAIIAEAKTEEEGETTTVLEKVSDSRLLELETRIQELEQAVAQKDTEIATHAAKEQQFKAREEEMKKKLNERLAEVKNEKEAAKQDALDAQRAQLTADHEKAIADLIAKHEKELADLREKLTNSPMQSSAEAEQIEKPRDASGEHSEAAPRMTFDELNANLTVEQARTLVRENELVNGIVKANIRSKVEKEKELFAQAQPESIDENLSQRIHEAEGKAEEKFTAEKATIIREKEEELASARLSLIKEQQELFEAEKQALISEHERKITDEVAKAKASSEKMVQAKLKMIQNQSAGNLAKVNVIKKAAEETPEKSVKEVWEVAKVAKALEAPKPAAQASAPVLTSTTTAEDSQTQQPVETNGTTSPTKAASHEEPEATVETSSISQPTPAVVTQAQQPAVRSSIPQPASQIARGGFNNRGARGSAQAGRGTSLPRGVTSGGQRGGANVNSQGRGRGAQHTSSPNRGGNLNPGAVQFTPAKRAREDGGDDGNLGKRIRGTSDGS